MSAEIWRHLGIPPTSDEGEIRRAYAERLKTTHPEDDPEGFKRLRNAYERALQEIRWRAKYDPVDVDGDWDEGDEDGVPIELPRAEPEGAEPPADQSPPERDEELDAHIELRTKLEQAIQAGPWEAQAAFKALVSSPAMERLSIYTATEMWVANLIRRHAGGGPLFDWAMAHFKWDDRARASDLGASMASYRESLAEEVKASAFLARVKDRRHEFHAAYKEMSRPPKDRGWLSRLISFPRLDLVRRFLDYVEDKAPYARDELDYEAEDWWRRRINFWLGPLTLLSRIIPVGIVIGVIALFVILSPSPDSSPEEARRQARASCTRVVERPTGIGAVCDRILELAPESLLMRQYAGIIALREGRDADARAHFEMIAQASPVDPAARYGLGMALSRRADPAEQQRGVRLMREALAIDDTVSVHFAQFAVPASSVLDPAETYEPFPDVPIPPYDTPIGPISLDGETVFADAYAYFGIVDQFGDGRVILLCLARATGQITDCRIMDETPRNGGRGEMALRIMRQATAMPATLNGDPVDGVPVRVPISFRYED